jgi:hypothetical protein
MVVIKHSQKAFQSTFNSYLQKNSVDTEGWSINQYWLGVAHKLHVLPVIVRILSSCSATEAACERFFSTEGITTYSNRILNSKGWFHNKRSNRKRFELTVAQMKIKHNYKVVSEISHGSQEKKKQVT